MKVLKQWMTAGLFGLLAFAGGARGEIGTSGAVMVRSLGGYDVEKYSEVEVGYPPFRVGSGDSAAIWLDGAELFSSVGNASFDWQPQSQRPSVLEFRLNGVVVTSKMVNVTGPFSYEIVDGKAIVTGVKPVEGNLEIPSSLGGCPVTSIGKGAFSGCIGLTEVTIPASVTSIGEEAFKECSALISVTIPGSVTNIGRAAFECCSGLTEIMVETDNMHYASRDGVLFSKSGDELVCFPCGRTGSYTIPSSVTNVGRGAFSACSGLTTVAIPDSVTCIGEAAFSGCDQVESVVIPQCVCSSRLSAVFPDAYSEITSVTIREGVVSIGAQAFSGCGGLVSLTIPSSVASIATNAFDGCSALKTVSVPQCVCLGKMEDVFPDAYTGIETLTVCDGVTVIVDGAFAECDSLKYVNVPESLVDWGPRAFPVAVLERIGYGPDGLMILNGWVLGHQNREVSSITVPEGVVGIGNHALADFWDLATVQMPASLKYIGHGAFETNTYLDNVVVPDGVVKIGDGAFQGCTYMRNLTIGEGVERIGREAFANCTQLATVEIPERVKGIGDLAFSNCWRMLSVKLPMGLETPGTDMFAACKSLTGVTMPAHDFTAARLFEGRYVALESVAVAAGERLVRSNAFEGCSALSSVALPPSLEEIEDAAFRGCGRLSEIELPGEALGRIGAEAFSGSGLAAVVLPDSVTELGAGAFMNCRALQNATLSRSLDTVPDYAFYGCSGLSSMVVPASVRTLGKSIGNYIQGLYYLGNAPAYDENSYTRAPGEHVHMLPITTYVVQGSRGWDGSPSSRDLPETWLGYPITFWEPNRFDAHFDANGGAFADGSGVWSCGQITGVGYVLPPQTPTLEGAEFAGWWTDPTEGAQIKATTRVNETREITFYAHWKGGGVPVTVRFNATGGTVTPAERTYQSGLPYGTLPVPTRAHYRFEGWWTARSGGPQVTAATRVPGADQELFARWTPETYAIRFHANGGTGTMADQEFIYGSPVRLRANEFQRPEWEFAGWALTEDGDAVYADRASFADVSAVQDGVIHLYAAWGHGTYAVRFDANGGTGRMDDQTFSIGKDQALELCQFTRFGFTFLGWATTSGGAVVHADGAEVRDLTTVSGGAVVLYAVWERLPLAVDTSPRSFSPEASFGNELEVMATVSWTASSSAKWLTLTLAEGDGDGSILYDVAENTGTRPRSATITVSGGGLTRKVKVTQSGVEPPDTHSGKQLWEGGPCWADTNVGAEEPWDYGYYFWWGDIVGYKWEDGGWVASDGSGASFKFSSSKVPTQDMSTSALLSEGWIAPDNILAAEHDAARVLWGRGWRIPTKQELDDLLDKCDWTWSTTNGVNGYVVRGRGDYTCSIFLPAAGYGMAEGWFSDGKVGGYWSSVPDTDSGYAWSLNCLTNSVKTDVSYRRRGFAVRPVRVLPELELGADGRVFTAAAASGNALEVSSTVDWVAASSASWLAVETGSGSGNGTIVYDVAANTGSEPRTGTITVTGGGITRTFTVTQEGMENPATQGTPVRVPYSWLEEKAGAILAANGNDHEAAAKATAANGRAVWECYVADVSVTDAGEDFKAALVRENGKWVAKPVPDRGDARVYTVEGTSAIGDEASWGPVSEDSLFFRVKAGMPRE